MNANPGSRDRRGGFLWRAALVVSFAFGYCLWLGRQGFMPLDQCIVFDGAWRIVCGQRPFVDFSLPAGWTPLWMQAGFFWLFGVNWLAYCLHAAVCNAVLAGVVLVALERRGASRGLALAAALGSACAFYPPFGVPYPDQHAFLFSLLAVVALSLPRRGTWREAMAGLGAMLWLTLGFLSKPIPTLLVIPLLGFLIRRRRAATGGLLLGGLLVASLALLAAAGDGPRASWFLADTLARGAVPGKLRLLRLLQDPRHGIDECLRVLVSWQSVAAWLTFGLVGVGGLLGLVRSLRSSGPLALLARLLFGLAVLVLVAASTWLPSSAWPRLLNAWLVLAAALLLSLPLLAVGDPDTRDSGRVVGGALWAASLAFALLTQNQAQNAMAWLALAFAASASSLLRRASRRVRTFAIAGCCAVLLFDAVHLHQAVNLPRRVHDRLGPRVSEPELPPALRFLDYRTPERVPYTRKDLVEVSAFLQSDARPFFLLGDASVLYGASGISSISPVLWFHAGLTYPTRNQPVRHREFETELLHALRRASVELLVVEEPATWNGTTLAEFPRLRDIARNARGRRSFGAFTVYEGIDLGGPVEPGS